jgi:2-iminobutanoate/2-iminopropanoate deaminase
MPRVHSSPTMLCALLTCLLASGPIAAQQSQPGAGAPRKEVINRPDARPGVLSTAVKVGDVVYLSGALGTKPGGGGLADGGIEGQTRQALENLKAALALAGGTMDDVVKCTVFLADVKDFAAMNTVYREFFPKDPPARSTVAVAALVVPNALIEIECIAAARR